MPDIRHTPRPWRFHVEDMIACGERVRDYTAGLSPDAFVADSLAYDATLRNLSLIGTSTAGIPEPVREARPEIPWREVIGLRSRLIHGYPDIDNAVVWKVIQDTVPSLVLALRDLLKATGKDD